MTNEKNPYGDKVFNRSKFEELKRQIDETLQELDNNLNSALRSGLTIEQIKEMRSDEDFRKFIENAKKGYIQNQTFVPFEEKMRIAETYARVYKDFHLPVVKVASILNNEAFVIDYDGNGTPHINKEASIEKSRSTCYDSIDKDKLFRLRNALIAFAESFDTFTNTLTLEGIDIKKGVMYRNDDGGMINISLSNLASIFAGSNPPLDLDDYTYKLFWLVVLHSA